MAGAPPPLRIVNAATPIRICDNGGWTDTWFAGHGKVFNIGVSPFVEVQLKVHPIGALANRVVLDAENYGDRYGFEPGALPGRHPLIETAVDELGLPPDRSVEILIHSEAPAGCSTGTSASMIVALIGALDRLTPGRMTPHEVAYAAHRVEVERLGMQSGIQDQLCAAYGGVNVIDIVHYPEASVTQLQLPSHVWWELDQRLALVFLGRAHRSSEVHDWVIASGAAGRFEDLRRAAQDASDAVGAGDFPALGRAMITNTQAQARLHPDLIGKEARAVIDVARAHGAIGWKVNGAGGEGGSITLLCGPDARDRRELLRAVCRTDPTFTIIPTHLSPLGLRVWDAPGER